MKYNKPNSDLRSHDRLLAFLDSLPDEFEIVEPGMTQVRWPEGWMKWRLCELAKMARASGETAIANDVADALWEMAAVAPVEKKKRMAYLWEYRPTHARVWTETEWEPTDSNHWRKVGECEVTE